ncbi:MAG TPA: DinB family protein [Gemmatimonadaceae bacterium]|nr:DinB family protein [Gemmatimonadaceae bacterium]
MSGLLWDLIRHRAWADAEHARAVSAHAPAVCDPVIRDRLHHMLTVQRVFLCAVGGVPSFEVPPLDPPPTMDAVVRAARMSLDDEREYVATLTPGQLDEQVVIPHFQNPPLSVTRSEALTQSALHSQHHRAQNATRLRELGGVPPTTDLILWYWLGRPAPRWE